jgi:hypothetical protein
MAKDFYHPVFLVFVAAGCRLMWVFCSNLTVFSHGKLSCTDPKGTCIECPYISVVAGSWWGTAQILVRPLEEVVPKKTTPGRSQEH